MQKLILFLVTLEFNDDFYSAVSNDDGKVLTTPILEMVLKIIVMEEWGLFFYEQERMNYY